MSVFIAVLAAMSLALAAPICEEESNYDKETEMCIASQEDVWLLQHMRSAEGRVHGQKTYFVLEKIPFKNGHGKDQWLRGGDVHSSFMEMVRAAQKKGFKFGVNSAYRTWEHQMRLWREMPRVAGNPYHAGPRSHMTGYSVDFSGTYAFIPFEKINPKWFSERYARPVEGGFELPTRFFWWLKRNAHKYGFRNTVPGEPWHWKYVGNEEGVKLVRK